MANNKFTFTFSKQPAKSRSKDLQNVSGTTATTSANVGVPSQTITQVINNITNVEGDAKQPQPITLEDFEALTNVEVNDLYIVYSSGSASEGWHTGGTFEYDGETYDDGTWFLRNELGWQTVDGAAYQKGQTAIFNPMPERLQIITSTAAATSYYNLPYASKSGLEIGQAACYKWNAETSQYEPEYTEGTNHKTNTKTLFVPFARSYQSGGETVYTGGALTAADYEQLMKGGGSIDLPIDSVMPSNPSDERVPSSKLVKTELAGKANASHSHSAGDITSGTLPVSRGGTGQTTLNLACNSLINSLHEGSSAPADSDFIICQYVGGGTTNTNYYRKPVSALWSYIKSKIDATSVQCDWSETDSNSSAYIKNKPTNVSAFTNDAGYLTSHQSLAEYTKKSDLPMSFAFAKRFINTLTTGWIPVCNITLNPTYLCDSSTAVRIARYRYNNNNYVDTTLRIQLRFQSDSYWVAFVSSTSTKNYTYKYAYSINGNVVTIYTYIDNDRYIMLEAYADDYDSTCTYTANTSSAVASGVTEIVDSQTPAEVSVYCGLDYSATNKGLYVTINTLAYWNGLAATGHSNLLYCDRGRFGTIVTKSKDDYSLSSHSHAWDAITSKPIDTEWGDAGTQSDAHIPSTKLVYDGLNGFVELITNTNTRVNNKADKTELNAYVKTTDLDSNYYNKTSIDLAVGMLQKKNDFINFKLGGSYANWQVSEVEQHGGLSVLDISRSTSGQSNYNLCIGITNRTTITNYNNYLLNHRVSVTCTMFNSDGSVKQVDALGSVSSFQNFAGTCFIRIMFNSNVVDPDFSSDPDAYNYFAVKFEPIN